MGIRDGKWKYICRLKDQIEELYDLSSDPDEKKNIAQDNENLVKKFRNIILAGKDYKAEYYKKVLDQKQKK